MIRSLIALLTLVLIAGCSPKLNDLQAYTQSVKERAQPQIEPYPEFKSHPPFSYTSSALRSPFDRLRNDAAPVVKARVENCLQPNFQRPKEALEAYGVDALALAGNFAVKGVNWALLKSNDGALHKAKVGSRIGLFYGKIMQIGTDSITIEQLLPDGAGCWQRKTTTMTTASKAGE
ncbi:pilus assembly protein PilP [Alteromonas sp. PRIM-21]|uniref:pilus assembly protein PilP n=1 Tax=Alteromonas sp. PRIM-21 TaxID=1454978 RepID=UPI0022B984A3|nr:pilus assembly protein PilP [Alteromonas sp. PRIM-21]MCZ8530651.1 pilus assembly protein PilP [Alteromonas sp. PRIM-21]